MSKTTNLKNRTIDENGNVIYNKQGLADYLFVYKNFDIPLIYNCAEEVNKYNKNSKLFNTGNQLSLEENILTKDSHNILQEHWNYPEEYDNINLEEYFVKLITTSEQAERVGEELKIYKEKNFEKVLRFCIYFMDVIKQNNLLIGVGRGSSCASYLLYLIGIHQIDSLKYDLDIEEFFK